MQIASIEPGRVRAVSWTSRALIFDRLSAVFHLADLPAYLD
jgi:hypothetical protein